LKRRNFYDKIKKKTKERKIMKNIMKKIRKQEKGAISTLVIFTVFMFVVILMGVYLSITNMQKSQLKSDMRIQDIYGEDVERVDQLYNEIVDKYLNETTI
jgi:hypothetical protein